MIEIKHRRTGAVLFRSETAETVRAAVVEAVSARVNLADADLADVDLAGADLADADLAGANLAGAYLADADLSDARNVPTGAPTSEPATPYKRVTDRRERARLYRERHPDVPVVEQLDAQILAAVSEGGPGTLDMSTWHTCETTHCRAGWAVHLAGPAGYALDRQWGTQRAGAAIYRASTGRAPHFFATTERALEDIKRCANEDKETV